MATSCSRWRTAATLGLSVGVQIAAALRVAADLGCVGFTGADAQDLHERLLTAMARRAAVDVAALYAPGAILVPAETASVQRGRREIQRHYADVLQQDAALMIVSRRVTRGCDRAAITGEALQIASYDAPTGFGFSGTRARRLRYRMQVVLHDGAWRIEHHVADAAGEMPFAVSSSRVETAAIPRGVGMVLVPPVPFRLPASPPVIVSPYLPYILTPGGAVVRRPDVAQRLETTAAPAPSPTMPPVPVAPIRAGTLPPLPDLPPPPDLRAHGPERLPADATAYAPPAAVEPSPVFAQTPAPNVPPAPFTVGAGPPDIPRPVVVLPPSAPPAPLTPAQPAAPAQIKRQPVVAGFARRTAAGAGRQAKAKAAKPPAPTSSYRSGRFVNDVPTFD